MLEKDLIELLRLVQEAENKAYELYLKYKIDNNITGTVFMQRRHSDLSEQAVLILSKVPDQC